MTVVYGSTAVLSGSGTWTYDDPHLIIGVKLELTGPPNGKSGVTGSGVRFWRGVGRYAFVDEAAPLAGRALFNDQVVDYQIGKSPVGLNYEWLNDAEVTATEILSAAPSGGGGGVSGQGGLNSSTTQSIPNWETGSLTWDSASSWSWTGSDTSGLVVPDDGVYVASLALNLDASAGLPTVVNLVMYDPVADVNASLTLGVAWPGSDTTAQLLVTALVRYQGDLVPAGTKLTARVWTDSAAYIDCTFAQLTMR